LVTYVLPPPLALRPEAHLEEPSWQIVLTDAFLRGAQFGRDLIYTYGPWGFLDIPRGDPRIYPWLFSGRLLFTLALALGASLIAHRGISRPSRRLVFLSAILFLADPILVLPMILFAITLPSRSEKEEAAHPIIHLVAVASALTMWTKFTGFVVVAALAAVLAVEDLRKRRLPVVSLEILASALAFWLVARQSLYNLPAFLRGAFSIASSYSAEMFLPGPAGVVVLVFVLLLIAAIPAAAYVWPRMSWRDWPSLSWTVLVIGLELKEAFVRFDSFHFRMGIIDALLPSVLILLCRAGLFDTEVPRAPRIRVLTEACAAGVVFLCAALTALAFTTPAGSERVRTLVDGLHAVTRLATGHSLSQDYRQQLAEFRRVRPLQDVHGTAAFFPNEQAMLYGNNMAVHLPPLPQAFSAYNAYLSGRNAAFYRGPNRPDFVFFAVAPFDERYPSTSDALSWLALMDCYKPADSPGETLVLRAIPCAPSALEVVQTTTTRAGETVTMNVPGGEAVWVQIDIRMNWIGSIVAALTRSPLTELTVGTIEGKRTFRISTGVAHNGFLLSPLIVDPAAFGRLLTHREIDPYHQVRDLMIVQSGFARRFYEPVIVVRVYRIVNTSFHA
jgi:hypothetical protein